MLRHKTSAVLRHETCVVRTLDMCCVEKQDMCCVGGHGLDSLCIYQRCVANRCVGWGDTDSTVGVFISDVSYIDVLEWRGHGLDGWYIYQRCVATGV